MVLLTVAAVLVLGSGEIRAQSSDNQAAAEQLYREGVEQEEKGDFAAACRKFEASLKLDRGVGTLLHLARCYEKTGRLASAWAHYQQAADQAKRERQKKRQRYAEEQVEELEPRLARLVIRVADGNRQLAGFAVTRDGSPVDREVFDLSVYVDAGKHEVVATAPGYKTFATTADAIDGKERTVEIPLLEEQQHEKPPDPGGKRKKVTGPGERPRKSSRRTIGKITGGAGIAVLATGLVFGLSAKSTWDDAFDSGLCYPDSEPLGCTPDGQDQTNRARRYALVSNILVGAGIAAVATGVVLYLTAPSAKSRAKTVRITPTGGRDSFGVAVIGRF